MTTQTPTQCVHDYKFVDLDIYRCRKCGKVIDVLEDADGY